MSAAGSPKAAPAAAPAVEIEDIEIPDVIERLPKPDKAAHDAAIAAIDATIKKLQARTNVVRAEMDALKTGRGGYGEQIQAAKAVFAELRAAKDNLIQQRNHLTAKVKSTLDKKDSTIKTQKSLRANLRFSNEEEFEKEIQSLRHQQETRSMSLNDEKRLVKEIEALQSQKIQVRSIPDDKSEVEKANESIKEIRALQTKKNAEIDVIQEKLTAQKLKLDELYKLNDEEKKQDKFPALAKERKEIKEQLDAEFTQLKQLRADFKTANDKYYENIRLVRKKKELERKKEEDRRRLDYEAKLSEYEKEMAKIHPFQDEQDLCDVLVAFLEKTYAKELKEEAESGEQDASSSSAPATLDGLQPLQRKNEEFMSFGAGKKTKKQGKKEGAKKTKRDVKLSLQMAQLDAYSTIGLVPPSTVGAISESLKAIKEKKEWFTAQTERPKKAEPVVEAPVSPTAAAAAPAAAVAAAKSSPKKKSNKKFNAGDKSAFPTLGGVEVQPSSPKSFGVPSWGPGMAPPAPAYSSFISQSNDEEEEAADYEN